MNIEIFISKINIPQNQELEIEEVNFSYQENRELHYNYHYDTDACV